MKILHEFYKLSRNTGVKSDRSSFVLHEYGEFCKTRTIEREYSSPRLKNRTGVVEHPIGSLNKLINSNLEHKICFTEYVNIELRVTCFTVHAALKITPELHDVRKPQSELPNKTKFSLYKFRYISGTETDPQL